MKPDHDTMMQLIRAHFGPDLQKAVTLTRSKDGIDVDYPTSAIEAFTEAVAVAERERMAQVLQVLFEEGELGPERFAYALAISTIRRGRLLTAKEQMENLLAAIKDEPVPHPAPETAI